MKIYFDGGCRPNPGKMEIAVVARGVTYCQPDPGFGTSLEAEWQALFRALEIATALGVRDLILLGDSAELIAKATGRLKARTIEDQHRVERFRTATLSLDRVRLRHVTRNQNLAGIALVRRRSEPWRISDDRTVAG